MATPPCHRRLLTGLPPISRAALRQHVNANVDRYFPLSPSGLTTDAFWQDGRKGGTGVAFALEVDVARLLLSGVKTRRPERITIEPASAPPSLVDLTPADVRQEWQRQERRRAVRWAMVTALAVIASIVLATAGSKRANRLLALSEAELAAARAGADARRELTVLRQRDSIALADRAVNARTAEMLGAIAEGLPDSAQLVSLRLVNGRVVRLAVTAVNPDELISALEAFGEDLPAAKEPPSLVRRGEQIWTHVVVGGDRP